MAFLDSGFFAHPDLVDPVNRILAAIDITSRRPRPLDLFSPDESSWHGMMTSVVACGNGRLSGGLYRGLAPEADLVLVKVGTARRIRHDDIRRGFDWVIRHQDQLRIRIVNVSCGGDFPASYLFDRLSRSAEEAVASGMVVVAAVGNLGRHPGHPVYPPASAPSVLAVGAIDDDNRPVPLDASIYHGSWGPTVDGLQKPEVLAPGIWLAAPILPGTPTAAEARLLIRLAGADDADLAAIVRASPGVSPAFDTASDLPPRLIRGLAGARLVDEKVISGAYKHVDGTSFAAPIVSSIAARMIEERPGLTPQEVKGILISTARRLPGVDPSRQGWGVVDARAAVEEVGRIPTPSPRAPVPTSRTSRRPRRS